MLSRRERGQSVGHHLVWGWTNYWCIAGILIQPIHNGLEADSRMVWCLKPSTVGWWRSCRDRRHNMYSDADTWGTTCIQMWGFPFTDFASIHNWVLIFFNTNTCTHRYVGSNPRIWNSASQLQLPPLAFSNSDNQLWHFLNKPYSAFSQNTARCFPLADEPLLSKCSFYISTLRPLALTRPIINMSDLITQTIYMWYTAPSKQQYTKYSTVAYIVNALKSMQH